MAIDKTKRPLRVPPQFQLYVEEHGLYDLYHRMLQKLIIDKPEDPLDYMINWLRRESEDVPKISVIGAPSSGKMSVAKKLAENLGAVFVQASPIASNDEEIITELVDRLTTPGSEPVRRGYVLDNIPRSRKQALLLQQSGIHPKHIIALDAPDSVLFGRRMGKHIDPETGNVYHNVFDWPTDTSLHSRLEPVKDNSKEDFDKQLQQWNCEKVGIFDAYKEASNISHVNSDQPQNDVLFQALSISKQPPRSDGVKIPRTVILGPCGSGKRTLAKKLCDKYKIVQVDADAWITILASDKSSSIGDAIRQHQQDDTDKPLPDDLMVRCVSERLSQMDCQTKGWILYGFPKNSAQAEAINMLGHRPNKVFSLELPVEGAVERLSNRRVDPVTGQMYHLLWNGPESSEVLERLMQAPFDTRACITTKYEEYASKFKPLKQVYTAMEQQLEKPTGGIFVTINADQDKQTVAEFGESMLINPVPLNK